MLTHQVEVSGPWETTENTCGLIGVYSPCRVVEEVEFFRVEKPIQDRRDQKTPLWMDQAGGASVLKPCAQAFSELHEDTE